MLCSLMSSSSLVLAWQVEKEEGAVIQCILNICGLISNLKTKKLLLSLGMLCVDVNTVRKDFIPVRSVLQSNGQTQF
jgi:hypothetical protein